jgi:hypothetical protein
MRRLLAKTRHWRAYLAADGKALEIDRDDARTGIVIGLADVAELERLLAKARGLLELRRTVRLPEDLEPPE